MGDELFDTYVKLTQRLKYQTRTRLDLSLNDPQRVILSDKIQDTRNLLNVHQLKIRDELGASTVVHMAKQIEDMFYKL